MIKMSEIVKKTDAELVELVEKSRETLREERFKDKFSRKASIIKTAKKEIAQALTEMSARQNKVSVK